MKAGLFFNILAKGRILEHRRKYRNFYEFTRIAAYPTYIKKSQEEYQQYLWDSSLTPFDIARRESFKEKIEEQVKQHEKKKYVPSSAVLTFFRGRAPR